MNTKNWSQGIGIITIIIILIIVVLNPLAYSLNKYETQDCKLYELSYFCEMSNNTSIIFELFIAGSFAVILSVYFYRRQEKFKEKRFNFAINRLEDQLYDLEPELQNVIQLINRANRLWNTIPEQRENFMNIISARTADTRRTLESIQGTLRMSFDVLEPMFATRIDYFTRNGIEFCDLGNNVDFDLLSEQLTRLNRMREDLLRSLPEVESVQTSIFNDTL